MKKLIFFPIVFLSFSVFVIAQVAEPVTPSISVWKWLSSNWELIALILSELMAFLPSKWTGIIKFIISVIGKIISLFKSKS
ncbi:MAG: hypothetical protein [Microvirus sp.]|nr:MAG: hypothetical protein [Microvirus sp.]